MKTPRIANAIGQIDDDLVAGAAKCKTKNKKHWLIWGSLAACFAACNCRGGNPPIAISGKCNTGGNRQQIQGLFYPSQRICNCMARGVSDLSLIHI